MHKWCEQNNLNQIEIGLRAPLFLPTTKPRSHKIDMEQEREQEQE